MERRYISSIPQIKVTLKGKKIYDPRTDTTAYSSNSALILLDYLRNTRYGKDYLIVLLNLILRLLKLQQMNLM
jgi:predicted phage tail protein